MFKYIKWEMKSLFKHYTKLLMIIGIILLLMLIMPFQSENAINMGALFAFILLIFALFIGMFLFGTKKVIDTFRKPTFMLESMIAFPPYKILLAKYFLAFILNIVCVILLFICFFIIIWRLDSFPNAIEFILKAFSISNIVDVLPAMFDLFIVSIFFTSSVTCFFVLIKSWFPTAKGISIIAVVMWYICMIFLSSIVAAFALNGWIYRLFIIGISALFYYFTVLLIENKLEVY